LDKIPVIAIVGVTASGKSELALRLCEQLGGEIISGDSMQIYRGMDIGTAKPTQAEMERVPHHLIDIADIGEAFSVALFIEKATDAAREIASRGKVPVIVGGTGLYIQMLLNGRMLPEMDSHEALRKELYEKAEKEGNAALHDYLRSVDPESADTIHPNNVKRVVRALEIYLTTGKTKTRQNELSLQGESPFDYKLLYLASPDRQLLYDRINLRVDKMMEVGLEDEVRMLYAQGLAETPTASQAIGYKEFFPYFEGKTDLDTVISDIKQHTRNYAKRQITFFNRMENKTVIDVSTGSDAVFNHAIEVCR
jgi:tRNA dimethylallyltransferase